MEEDLRYPIGRFEPRENPTSDDIQDWIEDIEALPRMLREAVEDLSEEQLDTPYRPGGWMLRQIVHHLGDAHLNAYVRFKLALTEDQPTVKPYEESLWAEMADYRQVPVETSLALIDAVHAKWLAVLRAMAPEDFKRQFMHPVSGPTPLSRALDLYSWHGRHHLAQVTTTIERNRW